MFKLLPISQKYVYVYLNQELTTFPYVQKSNAALKKVNTRKYIWYIKTKISCILGLYILKCFLTIWFWQIPEKYMYKWFGERWIVYCFKFPWILYDQLSWKNQKYILKKIESNAFFLGWRWYKKRLFFDNISNFTIITAEFSCDQRSFNI